MALRLLETKTQLDDHGRVLLKQDVLKRIARGEVDLQFRRWKRPTVKANGTLKTSVGMLAIERVEPVRLTDITAEDARRAGHPSRRALLELLRGREGRLYRITLRLAGDDPRIALRERTARGADLDALRAKLARMDANSPLGPWTRDYLEMIESMEGIRAPDLAQRVGLETQPFKARVRRLKELGLTESLRVGYRISLRGRSLLEALR